MQEDEGWEVGHAADALCCRLGNVKGQCRCPCPHALLAPAPTPCLPPIALLFPLCLPCLLGPLQGASTGWAATNSQCPCAAVPAVPAGPLQGGRTGWAATSSQCPCAAVPAVYAAGRKNWVGSNEWQGRPKVQVALRVQSQQVSDWILDRLGR